MPTLGGRLLGSGEVAGPFDQRQVGFRADVLEYTSEPLGSAMEITGPVTAELWVSIRRPRHRLHRVLIDVHPDGPAWNLCEGAVRARHAGMGRLGAGRRLPVDDRPVATSAVVPAGHRLRLHVSSSSFPEWEPNPNTGQPVGLDTDADLRVAHQTVYHDAFHPSHLVLPVIPS